MVLTEPRGNRIGILAGFEQGPSQSDRLALLVQDGCLGSSLSLGAALGQHDEGGVGVLACQLVEVDFSVDQCLSRDQVVYLLFRRHAAGVRKQVMIVTTAQVATKSVVLLVVIRGQRSHCCGTVHQFRHLGLITHDLSLEHGMQGVFFAKLSD